MIPNIETSYERIANAMIANLPEGWTTAQIFAIFYPDSVTFESEFQRGTSGPRSFTVSMELTNAFLELRRKFKDAGQPLWGQALFELRADGKFSLKWGYDNCDPNGNTIWNEQESHRRHEERHQRLIAAQSGPAVRRNSE